MHKYLFISKPPFNPRDGILALLEYERIPGSTYRTGANAVKRIADDGAANNKDRRRRRSFARKSIRRMRSK